MLNTSTTLYSLLLTLTAMPCSLPLLYRWWIWGSENVNVFKITQLISSLDRFKPREFDPNVYALILLYLPSSLGHGLNYWFSKVFQEASKPLSILGVGSPFQRRWLSPLLCPPPPPSGPHLSEKFCFHNYIYWSLVQTFFFFKKRNSTAQKQKWNKTTSPNGLLFMSFPRYYDFLDQKNFLLPFPTYQISPCYCITPVLPLSTWVLVGLPLTTRD